MNEGLIAALQVIAGFLLCIAVFLVIAAASRIGDRTGAYNRSVCNQAGYYQSVEVAGEWYCHTPLLDVEGLR